MHPAEGVPVTVATFMVYCHFFVKTFSRELVIPHSFGESWVGEALASRIKGD
jgi:hypothetical protein